MMWQFLLSALKVVYELASVMLRLSGVDGAPHWALRVIDILKWLLVVVYLTLVNRPLRGPRMRP